MADRKDDPAKKWEKVDQNGSTYRLKVGGGFLYRYDCDKNSAMVFVPEVYSTEADDYNHLHRIGDILEDIREGRKHDDH
jgi:hypothetical protein